MYQQYKCKLGYEFVKFCQVYNNVNNNNKKNASNAHYKLYDTTEYLKKKESKVPRRRQN